MTGFFIVSALVLYGIYIFFAIRYCDYNSLRRPSGKVTLKSSRKASRRHQRFVRSRRKTIRLRKGGAFAHD
jgi:hypothetical protein